MAYAYLLRLVRGYKKILLIISNSSGFWFYGTQHGCIPMHMNYGS